MAERKSTLKEMPRFDSDYFDLNSELINTCESTQMDNKYLHLFSVEKLKKKVLVNKKVILNHFGWNCLIGSKVNWHCLLCGSISDTKSCMNPQHESNMLKKNCRYLKEYGYMMICELSKSNTFHCGVCNEEITHADFIKDHCQLPEHKQNVSIGQITKSEFLDNSLATQATVKSKPKRSDKSAKLDSFGNESDVSACTMYLPITSLQVTVKWAVINKRIRLVNKNYHCIIIDDMSRTYCALCDENISKKWIEEHFEDPTHVKLLAEKNQRILLKYNYGIVSKLPKLNTYHCGVCNELLRKPEIDKHCQTIIHKRRTKSTMRSGHRQMVKNIQLENGLNSMKTTWDLNKELNDNLTYSNSKYLKLCVEKLNSARYMVNGQFIFRRLNWNCIIGHVGDRQCALCQVMVDINYHYTDGTHNEHMKVRKNKVLAEFGSNFICELATPNTYHCSFCNIVLSGTTEVIKQHCASGQHRKLFGRSKKKARKALLKRNRLRRKDAPLALNDFDGDNSDDDQSDYDNIYDGSIGDNRDPVDFDFDEEECSQPTRSTLEDYAFMCLFSLLYFETEEV